LLHLLPGKSGTISLMQASLRSLRIVWIALLIALGIYVYLPESLNVQPRTPSPVIFLAVAVVTIGIVGSAFFMRRKWIAPAQAELAADLENGKALARWRTGYLCCLALAESLGLYGLVLRFLGFTLQQVEPFYLAGLGLLLFFFPRFSASRTA
jgi:F0F1-type ATP synthase membrane subunit c/vacuolar-type H+-ATPase subunit K